MPKFIKIGELIKLLNSSKESKKKISSHNLRFWEKQFKQIKPYVFSGKRRYYDNKSILILKKIKFLLKNKGMTIKGVKIELQNTKSELDEFDNKTINKKNIKNKLSKIASIIKNLKSNG